MGTGNMVSIITGAALGPLLTCIFSVILGTYIYVIDHEHYPNRIFIYFMHAMALLTFLDFLQAIAPEETIALITAKLKYSYLILVPATFIHLSIALTDIKSIIKNKNLIYFTYIICLIFFLLSTFTDQIVEGVTREAGVYGTDNGSISPILILIAVIFLIIGLVILIITFRTSKNQNKRLQLKYIFVGMTITGIVFLSLDQIYPLITGIDLEGTIILTLPMFLFYGYSILKFKFLKHPKLVREKVMSVEPIDYDLESGYTYIIPETTAKKGFQLFLKTLNEGSYGICISLENPAIIRRKHGLKDTPIIWITNEETDEISVKPSEIATINDILKPFLEKATDSVILLLDYESITSGVNIENHSKILNLSKTFFETINKSNSKFIISVKPTSINPKNRSDIIKTKTPLLEFSRLAAFVFEEICNNVLQFLFRNNYVRSEEVQGHLNNLAKKDPFFKKLIYRKTSNPVTLDSKLRFSNILVGQRLSKQVLIDKIKLFISEFEAIETAIDLSVIVEDSIVTYGLSKNEFMLHLGDTYLLPGIDSKKGFEIFSEFVNKDFRGLCITKSNPKKVIRKYSLFKKDLKLFWLTDIGGSSKDILPPKLEHILSALEEFLSKRKENKIILIDGIEYLIFYSGDIFDAVLGFLRRLADRVSETNAILLIPLDPKALSEQRMSLLTRSGIEIYKVN
jgi:hypothetical protein